MFHKLVTTAGAVTRQMRVVTCRRGWNYLQGAWRDQSEDRLCAFVGLWQGGFTGKLAGSTT